jgi:hypothetical protein
VGDVAGAARSRPLLDRRIAQVAITVNGEACPAALSQSAQFPFVQRIFELSGGTATELPGVLQRDTVPEVLDEAIAFLIAVRTALDAEVLA